VCCVKDALYTATAEGCPELASKFWLVLAFLGRTNLPCNSRYRGHWFQVAVDASGVGSYDHQRDEQCLHRTSKNGKTTYFHSVLEARLVTPNGFSISIATEWIENPEGGEYDKQDCERKGFTRLAAK